MYEILIILHLLLIIQDCIVKLDLIYMLNINICNLIVVIRCILKK